MDPDVARTRVRMVGEDAYLTGSLTAARNIEGHEGHEDHEGHEEFGHRGHGEH